MLKYLVVLLDDSAISYCHYQNIDTHNLMPIDVLKKCILFAMKNDMRIQYVLPKYKLPLEYYDLMDTMFHDNIGTMEQAELSDVIVVDGINALVDSKEKLDCNKRYIVRTTISLFFEQYKLLIELFTLNTSVNIVFTDVESFSDELVPKYRDLLIDLVEHAKELILSGHNFNTNLLTDRIALDYMNNCGAGDSSITLAPNGTFYPCPAFYYSKIPYYELGNIYSGIKIPNDKLYKIIGAPLCKTCDAYHCKRCVWLNKTLTYEINTPSRQQCLMAHVERNASKYLLERLQEKGLIEDKHIADIDYLDPFDVYNNV